MTVSFLHIASFIAIFQALLMGVFSLQNKKNSRTSNTILASMLFLFAVMGASALFKSILPLQTHMRYHRHIFVIDQLAFLIGPLAYFYVRALLNPEFVVRRREWWHFLPFPVAVGCAFVVFQFCNPFLIWLFPGRIFFSGAVLLQSLIYLVPSIIILRSHGLTFKSFLSYIDNSRLAWVRLFISGYVVLWIIQFQVFLAWDALVSPPWCPYVRSLYFLTTFLLFNGMVYFGLKKPELFHQGQKYLHSSLKRTEKDRFQGKLAALMIQEKLYLNPSLTLAEIALKLELHPIYVSQIINETFHQNFREFLNTYRIEESKRMLSKETQNLNILGIALDAGFNSKSAFNRAFKKHTGTTPKEFRKRGSA
jgi:AraC-like DNA-binding protein